MAAPTSVDDYLAALPDGPRAALEKLRGQIKAAAPEAPEATETISYQMPAYRLNGRFLVSFAAFKNHSSLFPASQRMFAEYGDELEPYFSGKGTIRFTTDKPLPCRTREEDHEDADRGEPQPSHLGSEIDGIEHIPSSAMPSDRSAIETDGLTSTVAHFEVPPGPPGAWHHHGDHHVIA